MVAGVVAVVGAGAAVIFGFGFGRGAQTTSVLPATSKSFTAAQARTIETALNSGVPDQVSSVIELDGIETFDPAAAAQFAQLHLRLDPGSFATHEGNEASVNATSGAKPAHWVLLFAKSAGTWKIVATQQVGQ